jgi:multicomponent Na+:H+ antiporter subunit D
MGALPVLLPLSLLGAAAVASVAGEWGPRAARVVAGLGVTVATVLAVVGLVEVLDGGPIRHQLGGWPAPLGIEYVLDPLAAYMAVVVAVMGLVVVAYPPGPGFGVELRRRQPLYPLVLLVVGGLMGVVVTGDLFHLFVFLEIYAIASYALVALGGPRATFASLRYLVFGTVGSGLYLLGVGFLYFVTGSLGMADVAEQLRVIGPTVSVLGALGLVTAGLALKMALFPLHVWLPEAHSYAPPSVAALLAAVQVKVAAYALIRLLFEVFGVQLVVREAPVAELLVWFGAAGVLAGSVAAIRQDDLKRMLAYSTVAQLGYLGIGIGLSTRAALVAALFQVVSHALMKSCLFLVAGGIAERTGIRRISRMRGLARRMPAMAAALAVAALGMVGVPPTAGFFSKWYLLLAALDEGQAVVAVVIVASSLLTLGYVLRLIEVVYDGDGELDPQLARAQPPGPGVLAPVALLAAAVVVVGVANAALVGRVLEPIAVLVLPA